MGFKGIERVPYLSKSMVFCVRDIKAVGCRGKGYSLGPRKASFVKAAISEQGSVSPNLVNKFAFQVCDYNSAKMTQYGW